MSEKKQEGIGTIGTDTSFLIDFFNGEKQAVVFMSAHAKFLRISEIVVFEFLCGKLTEREQETCLQAMKSFPAFTFRREAAIIGSALFREAKRTGRMVAQPDCMIAGSYLAHGIKKIVTRDVSHFSKMKGIEVISY